MTNICIDGKKKTISIPLEFQTITNLASKFSKTNVINLDQSQGIDDSRLIATITIQEKSGKQNNFRVIIDTGGNILWLINQRCREINSKQPRIDDSVPRFNDKDYIIETDVGYQCQYLSSSVTGRWIKGEWMIGDLQSDCFLLGL